jgi:glutathione S-transferase
MRTLYLGNKNYSSWSLRGWFAAKLTGAPFAEVMVALSGQPEPSPGNRAFSPSARVPCLHDDGIVVWDSLAIAEYLAERHPGLWPADPTARAWARCITAEMHAGFGALRSGMSMDVRARRPPRRPTPAMLADVERGERIWRETRARFGGGGPMLFGAFGIADAFYAPVAFRFRTYGVSPSGVAGAYLRALLDLPAMREWEAGGRSDPPLADHDLDALYPDDPPAAG